MRNFDVDLKRVTYLHYITAKAAINFPWTHTTSGGWHYLSYWKSTTGQAKVSLAGIHYPDTSKYFGDTGIMNASKELKQRGWQIDHQIYMANHFRAAGIWLLLGPSANRSIATSNCPSGFQTIGIWPTWSAFSDAPSIGLMAQNETGSIYGLNRSSGKMVGARSSRGLRYPVN